MNSTVAGKVYFAFNNYVEQRAAWIGMRAVKSAEDEFLIRTACILSRFSGRDYAILKSEFDKLAVEDQTLLTEQLSFNQTKGLDSWARTPHYVATLAQNCSRQLLEAANSDPSQLPAAFAAALGAQICFAKLVKNTKLYNPARVADASIPLSFGEVGSYTSYPEAFNPKTFKALHYTVEKNKIVRPIKNLVFDLGHVFIEIDTSLQKVYEAFAALSDKSTADDMKKRFELCASERHLYHIGKMDSHNFRLLMKEVLKLPNITDEQFDSAFCASILAAPEVVAARLAHLETLRDAGYQIYLLSNNNEIHRNYVQAHYASDTWLGKYFKKEYYSNTTHLYKPDADSYLQVLKENNLRCDETIFFDDMDVNVVAARNVANINAVEFSVNNDMSDVNDAICEVTLAKIALAAFRARRAARVANVAIEEEKQEVRVGKGR